MKILYLLGIGKFYMENNTGNRQSSDMMSSVLSSTLSGQLNNVLSQIIDNNWNIGTNLSTGEKGWTDMEVAEILRVNCSIAQPTDLSMEFWIEIIQWLIPTLWETLKQNGY